MNKGLGYKPHKRPHASCIGWFYCARLDRIFDIGNLALQPSKKGYLCSCGRFTRLDPFKHEVYYYNDDSTGIDPSTVELNTSRSDRPTRETLIQYWVEPMSKPEWTKTEWKEYSDIKAFGKKQGWYAWVAYNEKHNMLLASELEDKE